MMVNALHEPKPAFCTLATIVRAYWGRGRLDRTGNLKFFRHTFTPQVRGPKRMRGPRKRDVVQRPW